MPSVQRRSCAVVVVGDIDAASVGGASVIGTSSRFLASGVGEGGKCSDSLGKDGESEAFRESTGGSISMAVGVVGAGSDTL
ncbi:hypothetical protein HYQ46_001465 [Verticillium longisporum]|nr:hypothetical protein HYQ46_001465 [Verticillium longisporum]